jgi:putative ABC transport system substrate-binding protein
MPFDQLKRREFITLLGGAAAWPLAAHAQQREQRERVRRIGLMLSALAADDSEGQARITAFVQGLQELNWTDGRNTRIEYRWGLGDPERLRKAAAELVALAPDVILAGGNPALEALQQASRTVPIVFANVADPVGSGYVASLARPGGNTTGFMSNEYGLSAKWLGLLKQIAPRVTRVAIFRSVSLVGSSQFAAIQAVAPSFGVELTPIDYRGSVADIEHAIDAFVHGASDGLIVTGGGIQLTQRDAIIALAQRHGLPAVYPFRRFATDGGLISFGADQAEPYRLAARYVDRHPQGREAGRPSGAGAGQVRDGPQPQDRQGARPHCAAQPARYRRRGHRMNRRDLITLLGGAAVWPVAARAQQADRSVVSG